ncbi:DUF1642 domain-containing protein [Lacticaseibacillus paracasei]|jgi:hypothetical protein|nr:DUF1642 domain-containing protein [Lacticaseibacillus paracasei]EKQ18199.1 hypothetical protein LCAUW4_2573 [Lacticaseibacillus casei UW4]MBU6045397.1 DUF1642 domain-containing protein [Lacticaseibacillus paracasei]MBU6048102.1 DUF1642 domain-containing protein [Lacticaseibacillus paracasei]MCL4970219.1 DUF1642 domain-containing protein [Lacticaseibacillus paracasei]MCL4972866.1 DUF1642 domain-containing protein [Lacticaseibacillus paracasei]
MSEEKLYAVKSDEGEYLDSTPRWNDKAGTAFKSSATTLAWAKIYDGHVVTLIEEPEKVVLTKEQAEIVEGANKSQYPATYISNYTNAYDVEESLLMNAYVNGYTVAKEKKYNVKVPKKWSGDDKHYWTKIQDGSLMLMWECLSNKDYMIPNQQFTLTEIEHYGLQDCEKEEVTDDAD